MMKKNFLKLLAIGVLPFFIAVSCSKDEKIEPLAQKDAQEMLTRTSEQMDQTIGKILQTDAMEAMLVFADLYGSDRKSSPNLAKTTQDLILLSVKPSVKLNLPVFESAAEEVEDTPIGKIG